MYNSSSFYMIGNSHKVCEDYAAHETGENKSIAVLSDGCSSSTNTDIGARCLVQEFLGNPSGFNNSILEKESYSLVRNSLGLLSLASKERVFSAADCTLFGLYGKDEIIQIFSLGDGGIAYKKKKELLFGEIEYKDNSPFYFSYLLESKTSVIPKRKFTSRLETRSDFYLEIESFHWEREQMFLEDNAIIAIFSDGISSVFQNGNKVSSIDVVEVLMDIKNVRGPFLERQKNKFKIHCKENNWICEDDISMAAIAKIK